MTSGEVVPANETPEKIGFKLTGPKAFLRAILDRREDPIRVNLTGAKAGLVTYRFFSDNIRVPIGVKVLSIHPTAILIKLENIKHRDVPVKVELRGTPPEGFRVGKIEIKPDLVRIKGGESKVDAVAEIPTLPIDVSNAKQTIDREVSLDLTRFNVQMDGPLPRVIVGIEPTSAANYRIKNVDIRVLSSYKFSIDEKAVTVLVHAALRDLKSLDRSRVYAEVDLRGKPKGTYKEQIKIHLPENVGLVKTIPDRVNVTLY
jgi:YbbR domain-containing protein